MHVDNAAPEAGFVLVVALQKLDATTTLFFGHARRLAPCAIRIVEFGEPALSSLMSSAAAVIFVRGLFEFGGLPAFAQRLGIPTYYFVDDNFIVLREQGGRNARFVALYSAQRVRDALRGFAGVLLSSPPLIEYFSSHQLHRHLLLYPPVIGECAHEKDRQPGLRLAFFGGEHLHELFSRIVLPAVRRLACERPVTLVAMGFASEIPSSSGLTVIHSEYDESYARGIETLRRHGVNVLIHLVDASQANSAYKNPHALISALALDAVPVVSDRAPYDAYCATRNVMCCSDSEMSWFAALSSLAHEESRQADLRVGLRRYCEAHFDGAINRTVINGILSANRRSGFGLAIVRRVLIAGFLLSQFAGRGWRRLAGLGAARGPRRPRDA
jgi:hypothetical protein